MFVKQLSVFLENSEGRLDEVLKILAQGGIDLLSASLADMAFSALSQRNRTGQRTF